MLISNLAEHPTLLVTGPPTVPGRDLNPGPLSFEASAALTELTRPVFCHVLCYTCHSPNIWTIRFSHVKIKISYDDKFIFSKNIVCK